ncbi:MAG: translation initiation factor 2 [Coprococcus sp.]|nr:translation initiation factor 2 [Coprococcus sp.]
MKGSCHFRVKSKKTVFEFTIRRNITVIKGDSATGKTTLLHMMYEYLRVGRESGYSVSADKNYFVYLRQEVGRTWQDTLFPLENMVIFIEENNNFVFSKEFAEFVRVSGNYFVLVNRSPLKMLPYSIHEIYEIITDRKRVDIKESFHQLKELYSNYPVVENNRMDIVVTEDSNSGNHFFSKLFTRSDVVSAGGNSKVLSKVQNFQEEDVLIIVDGAAFGAMIESCLEYAATREEQRISVWMPESFEYLILRSGVVESKELPEIMESPSDYIEAKEYESWERYFTQLLISITSDKKYKYSKRVLDGYYIQDGNLQKIAGIFPEELNKGSPESGTP